MEVYPYPRGFQYTSGGHSNVYFGWWTLRDCIFGPFCCRMMLRKVSMMSVYANIISCLWTHESGKRASWLLSDICTVQVLLRLGNLSTLRNTGVSAFHRFWLYTNMRKYIRNQTKCLHYHRWLFFRGVRKEVFHCRCVLLRGVTKQGSTVIPCTVLEKNWTWYLSKVLSFIFCFLWITTIIPHKNTLVALKITTSQLDVYITHRKIQVRTPNYKNYSKSNSLILKQ